MKKMFLLFTLLTLLAVYLTGCGRDSTEPLTDAEPVTKAQPVTSAEFVICDTFELITNIQGSMLELSLDTDLPDDTVISITVERSYWRPDNSEEFSRRYFEQESTVGEWRSTHEIDVAPAGWKKNLNDFRVKMAKAAVGFKIARISDDIEVSIVVPINMQTNAVFGDRNENLKGKAVSIMTYGNLVRGDAQLTYPL